MKVSDLYPELDAKEVYQNFLSDLQKSAKGEKTSLRFIQNKLPPKLDVPEGTKIQVIVIGGTICQSAIVEKKDGQPHIVNAEYITKPSFATAESFLSFVLKIIEKDIHEIVINSADTIEPVYENGKMDGILVALTKENKMEGLLNHKLGEEIEKYFFEKTNRKININLANDTVCLLLSGLSKYSWNKAAGGIIGTGINFAFFLDKNTAINLEAGGWSNFIQSQPGREIDLHSDVVGEYKFEKETSGGYLFKHMNYFIRKLGLPCREIEDSAMLSYLAVNDNGDVGRVARQILNHSAAFAGCQIAGLAGFLEKELTFVMQGSVFWKGNKYKERVEEVIKELEPNYKITFIDIPDADILGGAKVIL